MRDVFAEIAAERQRQKEVEGWSPEHDDEHSSGEMAVAAACYALTDDKRDTSPQPLEKPWTWNETPRLWPWHTTWWKPKDRRRDLIRAAALIVAEIERLDRAERRTQ